MNRNICLGFLSLLAGNLMAQERPNIILIMTDDQGWGDVGFNGNTIIKTPNLDNLAAQGMIFDRFYTGCAVSSPTRASVLTGRNPFRTGVFHANVGILRPEEVTLPELLQQQGYMTGHFGKWHLGTLTHEEKDANRGRAGNTKEYNVPMEHGYMESFVTESKVPTYDPMRKPVNGTNRFWDYIPSDAQSEPFGTHYWKHSGEKETKDLSGNDSEIILNRALPFMERSQKADRPFFSVLWFHTPHLPCVAGPKHAALYANKSLEERNYFGCISAMDEQVGRLVSFLKEKGLYENTIICFCSDNGPENNTPGTTGKLRGRKRDLYEGGIRVPAFVVWPGHVEAGQRTSHIASTYDYLPTFTELLHLQKSPYQLDGESLLPFFYKGSKREKPIVVLIQQQGTVIEQQYKLVYNRGKYELYNIEIDPSEKNNIAQQHPDQLKRLQKILDDSNQQFKASFDGEEYGKNSVNRMKQKWVDIKKLPIKK